jgi:hypothetical protein
VIHNGTSFLACPWCLHLTWCLHLPWCARVVDSVRPPLQRVPDICNVGGTSNLSPCSICLLGVIKQWADPCSFLSYPRKVQLRSKFQRSRGIIYKRLAPFYWNPSICNCVAAPLSARSPSTTRPLSCCCRRPSPVASSFMRFYCC